MSRRCSWCSPPSRCLRGRTCGASCRCCIGPKRSRAISTRSRACCRGIEVETFSIAAASAGAAELRLVASAPHARSGRLHRLVEIHDWQHNIVFLALSLPFLLGTHLAWAMESWRRRHGVVDPPVAGRRRRVRSAGVALGLPVRTPGRSVSGHRVGAQSAGCALRGPGTRPPAAASRAHGPQRRLAGRCTRAARRSAARTCRARARCCGRWAPTPCSRSPARRCARVAAAVAAHDRRDASDPGFAAGGPIAFLRRDYPDPRAGGRRARAARRCSSCSTSCFTARTPTIGWSARPACCAAWSIAARLA